MHNKKLNYILNSNTFYAHRKSGSNESLLDHMELTLKYYKKIEKNKNLEQVIKNIIKKSSENINNSMINYIYELYKAAIFYHDIGKINPNFQTDKMKNPMKTNILGSEHSILSARLYIDAYIDEIKETDYSNDEKSVLIMYVYNFAFIISRHHSKINDTSDFINKLEMVELPEFCTSFMNSNNIDKCYIDNIRLEIYNYIQMQPLEVYILSKLLYSCIVTSDYFSTYEYMSGDSVDLLLKRKDLFNKYKTSRLIKNIYEYRDNKLNLEGINKIRSDIFLETERNLEKNLEKSKIFFLEAPTGSGKTNTSINLARILYEKIDKIKSINYVFPFNTLIEQTDETLEKYFNKNNEYIPINSITSICMDENDDLNFEKAYINNIFRNYPIKLISHVNLFGSLFGVDKEKNYSFLDYINSVVIIDEIQAYNNKIWREFFIMIEKYADLLNIRFIIMSATLPDLSYLTLNKDINIVRLLEKSSVYYNMPEFKDRVKIDYSLLEVNITLEELKKEVLKNRQKKVLVEFIDKKSARNFYDMLKDEVNEIYEITGDDNNYERKKVLEKINNLNDVVVVATQTIEAGVDIDMDVGYKDISYIDSEEQFLGRINRNSKKEGCKAYFFNYMKANSIYRNDNRQLMDLTKEEYRKALITKQFDGYFKTLMNRIVKQTSGINENNIENFENECLLMNYKKVQDKLELIKSNNQQVFFNFNYEINGENISGKKVWKEYKELCMNLDIGYAEKQIKLSELKGKLNLFIYNIYVNSYSTQYYTEEFAGIWYVENGYEFIEDGKFNREKYSNYTEGAFL